VRAAQEAEKSGSHWNEHDTVFIRKVAGRHPELLRVACARMFEERLLSQPASEIEADEQDYKFLAFRLLQDGRSLCKQLWEGLANPELYGLVGSPSALKKEDSPVLSPYQSILIDIAHGRLASDTKILFELEQRGLIERADEKWRIFSEVLQQFVLMQEEAIGQANISAQATSVASFSGTSTERDDERSLTYMESRVYDYLRDHLGDVCDKIEIMQVVWREDNMPSSSALQKIIERIREKIEDDPESPYKLISVRGRGYMLRRAL
jgi:DNA-binding winged helix-turn-helix (wHTH) protein